MPLRSMTGFGQAEASTPGGLFHIEIRGVNNRFIDIQLRVPRAVANLESRIKQSVSSAVSRGSIIVQITSDQPEQKGHLAWDEAAVGEYIRIFREIQDKFDLQGEVTLSHLLNFSDFVKPESAPADEETLWKHLEPVLAAAVSDFQRSREAEARLILPDLRKHLAGMRACLKSVAERAPQRLQAYQQDLTARIEKLIANPPDPERIATEIAFMADRLDISEECTRLGAHLDKFDEYLGEKEPVGKKMNFLLQEMNREANTIGSKANDTTISHLSVELKEMVEKIREQIQNFE